jgi:transcriptional regulator with XRE-family HTH domain
MCEYTSCVAVARRKRTPTPVGRAPERVGARIRELRLAADVSQEQLGQPYLTRGAVSRIESGLSAPSLKTLVHFSRVLGTRVRDLLPPDL